MVNYKQKYLQRFLTKEFLQGLISVLFFAAVIYLGTRIIGVENIQSKVEAAGLWGPLLFILIKSSTIIIAPLGGNPLYLIAQPLFGYTRGAIYLFIGDIIGYTVVFYLSRIFGRNVIKKLLSDKQLAYVEKFLTKVGTWQGLSLARIIFFGFADLVSYTAGLTPIPFWQYILVTIPVILVLIAFYMAVGVTFITGQSSFAIIVLIFAAFPFIFLLFKYLLSKKRRVQD